MESKSQTAIVFEDRERLVTMNFISMDFFNKVTGLPLTSVALKFYLVLSTPSATLPHSVITDAHSDDTDSSRNV